VAVTTKSYEERECFRAKQAPIALPLAAIIEEAGMSDSQSPFQGLVESASDEAKKESRSRPSNIPLHQVAARNL
jgi:hypothetical protein